MRAVLFLFTLLSATPGLAAGIRWIDTGGYAWSGIPIALDATGSLLLPQWDGDVRLVAPDGSGAGFGDTDHTCDPKDVRVGADGTTYLACYFGVLAYGPAPGREKTLITPAWDASEVEEATALALAPSGALWIAAWNGLFRWDGPGSSLARLEEYATQGVAVAAGGDVFYTRGWGELVRLPAAGGPAETLLGPDGAGLDARLAYATRVAVGFAGEAYVAGWSSHNVFRVDPSGAVSEVIDARGDGDGVPFFGASGVAADGAGGFVVASAESDAVFRIAPDGAASVLIDETGDGVNGLEGPGPLAVDATGAVWVCDANRNVFRVLPDGSIARLLHASSVPGLQLGGLSAITIHPIGAAVVADSHGSILAISPSGAVSVIRNDWQEPGSVDARDIAYDLQGRLVAAGIDGLLRREFDGSWTALLDPAVIGPFGASGIAVGPAGDVFTIARYRRSLYRVEPNDTYTELDAGLAFQDYDGDLVAHADGTLSLLGNRRVWRVSTAGRVDAIRWDIPASERLTMLAAGASGRLGLAGGSVFFLETTNEALKHLDVSGVGSGHRMASPADLAIGLDGSLYVAAEGTHNVFRVTPRGEIQLALGPEGDGAGHELFGPTRLAVGPDGGIHVSHWLPELFRIAPPRCGDALDNDADGLVDRLDPECALGDNERAAAPACGLGAELALLLPALLAARTRWRRARAA